MSKAVTKQEQSTDVLSIEGLDEFSSNPNDLISVKRKPSNIKLGQQMSQFVKDGLAGGGDWFCDGTSTNYGKELEVIVLDITEGSSLVADRDVAKQFGEAEKDKLLCYSRDLITNKSGMPCQDCPYNSYWNDWSNGPPKCKKFLNFIVMTVQDGVIDPMPKILTARKTSYKSGKDLAQKTMNHPKGIKFLASYVLSSSQEGEGYFVMKVGARRSLTTEEVNQVVPVAREMKQVKQNQSTPAPKQQDDKIPF